MRSLIDICLEQKTECLQKLNKTVIEDENNSIKGEFFVSENGYGVRFQYRGRKYRIFMNETVIPGREQALIVFARWKMEDVISEQKWQKFIAKNTKHKENKGGKGERVLSNAQG